MIPQFVSENLLLILAVIASFFCGALCVWLKLKDCSETPNQLNTEYIKGFNYLVNDQSDKAVEVFVKALEVDSETVELHLALGGLFRREGQVGRATRIHQNIIARPYLTEEQNCLAVFELARDYFKAGLFDRAENLFLELIDRKSYVESSLVSLLSIYESEKEWQKTIEIAKKLTTEDLPDAQSRISHYWCEIAEIQIANEQWPEASHSLKQARSSLSDSRRATFLEGKILLEKGLPKEALETWQVLLVNHDHYSDWVSDIICQNIAVVGSRDDAIAFLKRLLADHCSVIAADKYIELNNQSESSWGYVIECIGVKPSKALVYWLLQNLKDSRLRGVFSNWSQQSTVIYEFMASSAENYNARKCDVCGFESNTLNWQCPSCKRWDTQNTNI